LRRLLFVAPAKAKLDFMSILSAIKSDCRELDVAGDVDGTLCFYIYLICIESRSCLIPCQLVSTACNSQCARAIFLSTNGASAAFSVYEPASHSYFFALEQLASLALHSCYCNSLGVG